MYLLDALDLCFSLFDGSVCGKHDVGYICGRPHLSTACRYDSSHQDPFSEFHSITVHAYRSFWSLPTVAPWVEFRICYHDFMLTRAADGMDLGFSYKGLRLPSQQSCCSMRSSRGGGIRIKTLQHVIYLHHPPPLPARPAPAQGQPVPPVLSAPQMPNSPVLLASGEAHMVIHVPDTPELVVIISDVELMEDLEDDPEFEEH